MSENVKLFAPAPLPATGLRELTLPELMRRMKAMSCPQRYPQGHCQGEVYVTLFFDGTENSQEWEEPGLGGRKQRECNKHSNVARLYNSSIDESDDGIFSYYIPGIGTPFKEIGDYGGWKTSKLGSGLGYKGADRINWGITRVFNAVHRYVAEAPLLQEQGGNTRELIGDASASDSRRNATLAPLVKKLQAQMESRQRKINQINVAVFGFSRGAACARAFAHWLMQLAQVDGEGHVLAGAPLKIMFMGLFDTVASVGVSDAFPGADGHMGWADDTMSIHPAIKQCVHFIALHEQRVNFPLEMADGPNVRQVGYPGMHADTGGGYLPGQQGKAMSGWGASPHLSQVALVDMHHAAMLGGVPLLSAEEIRLEPKLAKDFDCPPALIEAVNAYYRDCGIVTEASGEAAVKKMVHAHTRQYLKWRKTLNAQTLEQHRFFREAILDQDPKKKLSTDQQQLLDGVTDFWTRQKSLRNALSQGHLQQAIAASEPLPGMPYSFSPDGRALDAARQYLQLEEMARAQQALNAGTSFASNSDQDDSQAPKPDAVEMLLALALDNAPLPEAARKLFEDYVHDSRAGFRPIREDQMEGGDGYFRYRHVFPNDSGEEKAAETKPATPLISVGMRRKP